MSKRPYNHPVNHIGLSVPDLEAAERWYISILGLTKLGPIVSEDRAVNPHTAVFKICPPSLRKVKIAYLSTGNGVGLELFQFVQPHIEPGREADFDAGREFRRGGFFHIAVTVPDVDGLCEKVVENGGKKVAQTVRVFGEDGAFIQDPWGNAIELISSSWEQLLCNRDGGSLVED